MRTIYLNVLGISLFACVACERPIGITETTSVVVHRDEVPSAKSEKEPPPMARLDDDMQDVIDQLNDWQVPRLDTLSVAEARKQPTAAQAVRAVRVKNDKSIQPMAVANMDDRMIRLPGRDLPIRIYTPIAGKSPFPIAIYFHGGGFALGSIDSYDASIRALANGANAIVVAVEYRKAPESRFPAAHEDALAAYEWVLGHAATFGGDATRVAVVGEGAGGNLAANVSIASRDKRERMPIAQVLIYPIASNDLSSPSYTENAEAKPLGRATMAWFLENYVRTMADLKDPRLNLVGANVAALPPTLIVNAEADPLRSEGEMLAMHLRGANVKVMQKTFPGVTHDFFGMGAHVSKARDAMDLVTARLREVFTGRT